MYMDKSRLDRKSGNATQSVEALHQLASSYFVDRDGTMRRLHEIQISTGAIKVQLEGGRFLRQQHCAKVVWVDGQMKFLASSFPMELAVPLSSHSDWGCPMPYNTLSIVIKTTHTDFLGQPWLWSWGIIIHSTLFQSSSSVSMISRCPL